MSNKFQFECLDNLNRTTVSVRALEKVSLYELAEALYDECCLSSDSCYLDDKFESICDVEFRFTPMDSDLVYSFTQHCYWMNPVTILSDIARHFIL